MPWLPGCATSAQLIPDVCGGCRAACAPAILACLQGAYRPHQLKNADITISSLTELSVINLRRMFANMGHEHMDLQVRAAGAWQGSATLTVLRVQ